MTAPDTTDVEAYLHEVILAAESLGLVVQRREYELLLRVSRDNAGRLAGYWGDICEMADRHGVAARAELIDLGGVVVGVTEIRLSLVGI